MCTGAPAGFYRGFAALNLTELQHPTSYNGTCMGLDVAMESTTNGPYLSMPQDLTGVDPAWHTCNAVLWGAFDPPIALHTATALVGDPGKKSPPTPAPGSPVAPPHAPATPTAPPVDPGKPATNSPAPNALPQDPPQQNAHSPDPSKSPDNNPKPDPQDPGQPKTDPSSPVESLDHNNNGDPATSAAVTVPLNGENGVQGHPDDPPANDPQPTGEVSKGDPVADPGNAHNAAPLLSLDENHDPSSADHAQLLPSIGGHQLQAASGGGVIIASTTLQQGQQTTIAGTPLSVGKGQIVIAGSTIPLPLLSAGPIITLVNGDIISAGGQAATVSGTTVALAPNNNALVVNGKTSPFPPPPTPILTVADQTITPAPAGFAIGGQSVLPGGPAVTLAGSTFSLPSGGKSLIVNGKATPLPSAPMSVFKVGSQTLTAAPTGFAIGGQSVLPGGPAVTFAGTTFSLPSGGNALIVNGKPTPLPSAPVSVFKVGSQTFTAAPTGFAVGTQSVSPGASAVTVDGTLVSLGSSELVIGTSTVPLGSAAQAGDGALGSLIIYGIGGGAGGAKPTNGSSNVSDVQPFLGGSGKLRVGFGMVVFALVVHLGTARVVLKSLS